MSSTCPNCGLVSDGDSVYCLNPECGTLLTETAWPDAPTPPSGATDPADKGTRATALPGPTATNGRTNPAPDTEAAAVTSDPAAAADDSAAATTPDKAEPAGTATRPVRRAGPTRVVSRSARVIRRAGGPKSTEAARSAKSARTAGSAKQTESTGVVDASPPAETVTSTAPTGTTVRKATATGAVPPKPRTAGTTGGTGGTISAARAALTRNRLLLPGLLAAALLLTGTAIWLARPTRERPTAAADNQQPHPRASYPIPTGSGQPVPTLITGPGTTPPAVPNVPAKPGPRPAVGGAGAAAPPVAPRAGRTTSRSTTNAPKPAVQAAKPATTTKKPAAVATPTLNMTPHVDCPDWGVHLTGSVANAGGKTIERVQVYHGAVGSTPADSFYLSRNGGSGSFGSVQIETWVPNYNGDAFRDGSQVSWRVTAYLTGGTTVVDSGTSSRAGC